MNNSDYPGNAMETKTTTGGGGGDNSEVEGLAVIEEESIPLPLFLVMSILAALGVCYSLALILFNVVHRKKKIIKMTSPNVNVVILIGCCVAFIVIVLLGLASPTIPRHIIPTTLQACVFLLSLSFTLVYGSLFAKVVRIHMIFTNLSFNGKSARDEHLLLGVAVLMLLDLAIVLPWQLIDPITCQMTTWKMIDVRSNITYATMKCSSELQVVWISLLYAYKVVMLSFGLYFTWQTRFVTLPSIRDARLIFGSVQAVALLGLTVCPLLLVTNETSSVIKYSVGSLAIWFSLTTTITFLFIPKARLLWMEKRMKETAEDSNAAARMQFSESMTKTKKAASRTCGNRCLFCCCTRSTGEKTDEDRYAQEILATEIETLKRTIKEKDVTIRELTDRLYVGTERFQRYLTTKTNSRSDLMIHRWPHPPPDIDHQQQQQRGRPSNGTSGHSPGPGPTGMADNGRRRNTGGQMPVRVNDRGQRLQPIPAEGDGDKRDELRNYRLSRYYRGDDALDDDYDDDYDDDSRSYSDASCSTCAAADLLEMQMRDAAGLWRQRQPATDGLRELSAVSLQSLSYEEALSYAQRGVPAVFRPTPSTAASSYSPPRQGRRLAPSASVHRGEERTDPSSGQDSAYDNSPSSTAGSAVQLVGHSSRRRRPPTIRTEPVVVVQRTIEANSGGGGGVGGGDIGGGDMDRRQVVVGVFNVHRAPTEEDDDDDDVTANGNDDLMERRIRGMNNNSAPSPSFPLPSSSTSSSSHHPHVVDNKNGSRSQAPPLQTTTQELRGGTVPVPVPADQQIPIIDLNPLTISVQIPLAEPMTSSSQYESSQHLVSSQPLVRSGANVPQPIIDSQLQAIGGSDAPGDHIRTYGLISVTQI